jgi:hypothetical protein
VNSKDLTLFLVSPRIRRVSSPQFSGRKIVQKNDLEFAWVASRSNNLSVMPVLKVWQQGRGTGSRPVGAKGTVGPLWDVLANWRAKAASTVTGHSLDCGHFPQEERPRETFEELQHFFGTVKGGNR